MDHAVLVDLDVKAGSEVVKAVREQGREPTVAIIAVLPEYYDPRFIFAADWLDDPSSRVMIGNLLRLIRDRIPPHKQPALLVLRTDDPLVRDIRKTMCPLDEIEGTRLTGSKFGGRYIEDGYAYIVH